MNIQDLQADCLKAILVQVPLTDFIRNVKLVSRHFRDAAEASFKELTSRQPISFYVFGNCRHCNMLDICYYPPTIYLADILVPTCKFALLEDCYLLPYVSRVELCEAFCESLPFDFRIQLTAILRKLTNLSGLELVMQAPKHYGNPDDEDDRGHHSYFASLTQRPFIELVSSISHLLSALTALELCHNSINLPMRVNLYDWNKRDFAHLLNCTKQLKRLAMPLNLLLAALSLAKPVLANVEVLELVPCGPMESSNVSCQNLLSALCETCTSLEQLCYYCNWFLDDFCCSANGCIVDFTVLQKLGALKVLKLELGRPAILAEAYCVAALPLLEFLDLQRPCHDLSANQALSLMSMAPNASVLYLNQSMGWDVEHFYGQVRQNLRNGFKQLENLQIDVASPESYSHLHKIITEDAPHSLRRLDLSLSRALCDIDLPAPGNPVGVQPAFTGLAYAVNQAQNISRLAVAVRWSNTIYLKIEQLLLALSGGSIQCVILNILIDAEGPSFEFDNRVLSRFLPAGCEIRDFVAAEASACPTSVLIVGKKSAITGGKEDALFWFTLVFC